MFDLLMDVGILADLGTAFVFKRTDLLNNDAASDKTMFVVFKRIEMDAGDEESSQSSRIRESCGDTKDS